MTILYNCTTEKEKRRSLRNNMPPAEKLIWQRIRGRQIEDCKFRRQYSIGVFVVDFYVPELKLVLEIDGESHFVEGAKEYDDERTAFLESKGTQVLRFTNQQIYEELDAVLERITETIRYLRQAELVVQESTPPHPSPCKGEGVNNHKYPSRIV
jgi:very-short-patch-repair endonuclease